MTQTSPGQTNAAWDVQVKEPSLEDAFKQVLDNHTLADPVARELRDIKEQVTALQADVAGIKDRWGTFDKAAGWLRKGWPIIALILGGGAVNDYLPHLQAMFRAIGAE